MSPRQRNLGTRHLCATCGTRYYDLNRETPACPRCGTPPDTGEPSDPKSAALARLKAGDTASRGSADPGDFSLDDDGDIDEDDDILDLSDEDPEQDDGDEESEELDTL